MLAAMSESSFARITTPVQVMYFDTDAGGVVHNIAYLRFIEIARTLLALKIGMDFEEIKRTQIHPVVARTEIDYRRPRCPGRSPGNPRRRGGNHPRPILG